jgi:hypothetical protein
MNGMTRSSAPGGSGFLLRSAAPTAPGEAVFALGRVRDAQDSSGACERQHRAHAGPAVTA